MTRVDCLVMLYFPDLIDFILVGPRMMSHA